MDLPAIALAQARRAGWFPLSSFLFPISGLKDIDAEIDRQMAECL
jgi:hypothetical protein